MSALRQARSYSLLLSWYRFRVKQLVCDTDNMASGVWRYMFPAKIGQGHSWSCHIKGYPGFDKCVVFGAKSALLKVDTKGTRPTSWMASTKCSQCLTMRSCWQHVNRYSRQTASSAKGSSCRLKSDHPTAGCCVLMGDRCSGHWNDTDGNKFLQDLPDSDMHSAACSRIWPDAVAVDGRIL